MSLRYVETIPFQTPESLDVLHGPTSGQVRVPAHICTAPDPVYNIDRLARRRSFYSAVVRDGLPEDQAAFLDRETLLELWPDLNLPRRCRETWTAKFPELAVLPVRALAV